MRRVFRVFAAVAALSPLLCASARADVVFRGATSTTGTGSTITLSNVSTPAGTGRMLAVGISTTNAVTISGVSYGGLAMSRQVEASDAGVRAEIWAQTLPAVGTADVVVTLSGSATATVGAVSYGGVDEFNPLKVPVSTNGNLASNSASTVENQTVRADALFGVIALGNLANTFNLRTGGSADLVTADVRWNADGTVHGAGATRIGFTAENQATTASINWLWNNINPGQLNPYAAVMAGFRAATGPVTAPTLANLSITGITTSSAALASNIASDGNGQVSDTGFVYCASPCTPAIGGGGVTQLSTGKGAQGQPFSTTANGLAPSTTYSVRAYAINSAGTSYTPASGFSTLAPNAAPTASAGGPYTIDEGSPLTLSAAGSSDPDGDALTYTWDVNGDGTYGDATGVSPTLTWSQLTALGLDGPATRDVTVRVSDPTHPAVTSSAAALTVVNVAPTATPVTPSLANEGRALQISLTGGTDASPADAAAGLHYAFDTDGDGTFDVGDGTYAGSGSASSTTFTPDDDGTRSVRLRVIDRDDGQTTYTRTITVTNLPPNINFPSLPAEAVEGSQIDVVVAGSDISPVDNASLHYAFDFDGDGTWDLGDGTYGGSRESGAARFTAPDGPRTYRWAVRVIDKDGAATTGNPPLTVTNAAPTATLGNDGPVTEGDDATISFTGASDPSAADEAAGFHYAFDLDDDGIYDIGDGTYAGSPASPAATLPTDDDGTLTVAGAIIDRDDGSTRLTTDVIVDNGAPTVSIAAPTPVVAGSALELTLRAEDPSTVDAGDVFAYEVGWGDGAEQTLTGPSATKATHTYATSGSYTISVVAVDKDGGRSAAQTLAVAVTAVPEAQPAQPAPQQAASNPPAAEIARVSGVSVRPRCVSRASLRAARAVTLRYRLNLAAPVRVGIQRRDGSSWRHCPPAHGVKKPRRKPGPVTYSPVTSRQVSTRAGSNSLVVASGRARAYAVPIGLITKGRKLRPGTYLVTLTTLDAQGRAQASAKVKFWVVSRRG